ncbi:PREDICTED: uncharacterized protein LOC109330488 [Lupinus angustifolius]|uniref:uncharacterized protein LOC109330488 n=1 Tax=Lupinus angustifolius TaxID=3871 RepID=UPI00092F6B41|nr:PREDICTED: uncharacterized protein LOC109330488 [Lupinus angustifolius]
MEVLERFKMSGCNSVETLVESNPKFTKCEDEGIVDATMYRQIVGCLRYLCHSRPKIAYGVGLISRFMRDPRQSHLTAAKRIMRYLKGTIGYGIMFSSNQNSNDGKPKLTAYSYSDWCGDLVDRNSTIGQVFLLSGSPIS